MGSRSRDSASAHLPLARVRPCCVDGRSHEIEEGFPSLSEPAVIDRRTSPSFSWFESTNHYYLTFPLLTGGELLQKILDKRRFTEEETRKALVVILVRQANKRPHPVRRLGAVPPGHRVVASRPAGLANNESSGHLVSPAGHFDIHPQQGSNPQGHQRCVARSPFLVGARRSPA